MDGWPCLGGYTISVCNKPTRSTQPCIPPGSLNRVPASAGVRAGMSPLLGGSAVWSHVACEFPCGNLANCYTLVTCLLTHWGPSVCACVVCWLVTVVHPLSCVDPPPVVSWPLIVTSPCLCGRTTLWWDAVWPHPLIIIITLPRRLLLQPALLTSTDVSLQNSLPLCQH